MESCRDKGNWKVCFVRSVEPAERMRCLGEDDEEVDIALIGGDERGAGDVTSSVVASNDKGDVDVNFKAAG